MPPKLEKKYPFTDEVLLTLPVDTLAGANLPGQILAVTDLDGRDLQGANRAEAKLAGCSPRGAVLTGTGLTCFPPRDFQGTTE